MALDHSNVDVTILMDGLGVLCFNNSSREMEIGVLKNPRHSLSVDILRVSPQGVFPIEHQLDFSRDIEIDTVDVNPPGVSRYYQSGGFTRRVGPIGSPHDDFEDFRWIVDLEDLHANKLHVDRHPSAIQIESELTPIIRIKQGVFYSMRLTGQTASGVQDVLKLVDWHTTPPTELRPAFTIADVVAADIRLNDGGAQAVITNKPEQGLPDNATGLPKEQGVRYLISIKNICSLPIGPPRVGSDFRVYYDVVSDEHSLIKFDFDKRAKGRLPQNCDFIFLGMTDTLGQ